MVLSSRYPSCQAGQTLFQCLVSAVGGGVHIAPAQKVPVGPSHVRLQSDRGQMMMVLRRGETGLCGPLYQQAVSWTYQDG